MKPILFFTLAASLLACAAEGPTSSDPLDFANGKADVTDRVDLRGTIEFGAAVQGELIDDFQLDAWAFGAKAGAVIAVEITRAGSSAALDDVLYVYGPSDEQGSYAAATRLASDDDAGWGAHARIRDLALPADGNYLVVVGTEGGEGRGRYNLELSCASGDCAREVPALTECDGAIASWAELCMEAKIYDDGESPETAFEDCAGEDALAERFVDECEYSSAPPAYCGAGLMRFQAEMIPACRTEIGFGYGLTLGPIDAARRSELVAWAEAQTLVSLPALPELGYERTDGVREIRRSTASALDPYPSLDAWELADLDPAWRDVLLYEDPHEGFTEARELEWELYRVLEIWSGGAVIGYLGHNEASVCYWHDSDPDDPTCNDFAAWVIIDTDGAMVRELYDGP